MTDLASWFEQEVQSWWANGDAFTSPPSNIYVALHTADPTNDASQGEVDAADYERLETGTGDWQMTGEGPTNVTNPNELQFPTAQNNWGSVSHLSLWTAQTGGNPLWQGAATNTKQIDADDRYVLEAGEVDADLD